MHSDFIEKRFGYEQPHHMDVAFFYHLYEGVVIGRLVAGHFLNDGDLEEKLKRYTFIAPDGWRVIEISARQYHPITGVDMVKPIVWVKMERI